MKSSFTSVERTKFWVKSRLLMLRRMVQNLQKRRHFAATKYNSLFIHSPVLAEHKSALYSNRLPEEQSLQNGKVENLRIIARMMNGLIIEPGQIFSFWSVIGHPGQSKGFVVGRELRQGCIIPTLAGGICQFSNGLCAIAHQAGMEINERHRHTAQIDGVDLDPDSDATLFWNYLDFRFRTQRPVILFSKFEDDMLVIRLHEKP